MYLIARPIHKAAVDDLFSTSLAMRDHVKMRARIADRDADDDDPETIWLDIESKGVKANMSLTPDEAARICNALSRVLEKVEADVPEKAEVGA